jgi:hypothetical protein
MCSSWFWHKPDIYIGRWNYMDWENTSGCEGITIYKWRRIKSRIRFYICSGRSRHTYDSDIAGWNYMDWQRKNDILR